MIAFDEDYLPSEDGMDEYAQQVVLWIYGRMSLLEKMGYIKAGAETITESGFEQFLLLEQSGFQPEPEEIYDSLLYLELIEPEYIERLVDLLLGVQINHLEY